MNTTIHAPGTKVCVSHPLFKGVGQVIRMTNARASETYGRDVLVEIDNTVSWVSEHYVTRI